MCQHSDKYIEHLWERLDREAIESKFSQQALVRLRAAYDSWDSKLRERARVVLAGWLKSDNPKKRFDVLALVDDLSIMEALENLEQLEIRLQGVPTAESKHELERVQRLRRRLSKDRE